MQSKQNFSFCARKGKQSSKSSLVLKQTLLRDKESIELGLSVEFSKDFIASEYSVGLSAELNSMQLNTKRHSVPVFEPCKDDYHV